MLILAIVNDDDALSSMMFEHHGSVVWVPCKNVTGDDFFACNEDMSMDVRAEEKESVVRNAMARGGTMSAGITIAIFKKHSFKIMKKIYNELSRVYLTDAKQCEDVAKRHGAKIVIRNS